MASQADRFNRFLSELPHACVALQRVLVDRLRDCGACRVTIAVLNVRQRLALLLLRFGQRYGVPDCGGTKIALDLSQKDLAAFVGASARAVAREMENWRQRDIIATGRLCVVIKQPLALRRLAGPSARPP